MGGGFGGGMVASGNKMLGRAIPFDALVAAAFGVDLNRVTSPPGAPTGAFDLLMTAPDASKEQLQAAIQRQLGYVAHLESRATDVLLLTVQQVGAPGLQPSQQRRGAGRGSSSSSMSNNGGAATQSKNFNLQNQTIASLVKNLQPEFKQPILDRTGLAGTFDVSLDISFGNGLSESDAVRQALPVQLGLQLAPAREPLDILIVEKAK
jgi:uncharacterized protein (TIGR03435 family)